MKCKKCKKWISLYLDGELTADQEDLLFSHIENCPKCAGYYEDMVLMLDSLLDEEKELPEEFSAEWHARLAQGGKPLRRVNYKVFVPALAACLCGVFVMSAVFAGDWDIRSLTSGSNERAEIASTEEDAESGDGFWGIFSPPDENSDIANIESGEADGEQAGADTGAQDDTGDSAVTSQSEAITSGTIEGQESTAISSADNGVAAASSGTGEEIELVPGHPVVEAKGKDIRGQIMAHVIELQASGAEVQLYETEKALILEADSLVLTEILLHFELENVLEGITITDISKPTQIEIIC